MNVTIRACGPDDAAALALVAQATFLDAFAGVIPAENILGHCRAHLTESAHAAWLARPEARLWLAEIAPGAAPIGYAGLGPPDLPVAITETDTELKRIYALSRFHGTPVGPLLLAASLQGARDMGKRRVLLGVYAQNARAIAFYRKHGFVQIGVRRFQVGPSFFDDAVLALGVE
jgi:ribosomal protein S18 acetylase RimI-like enzyme